MEYNKRKNQFRIKLYKQIISKYDKVVVTQIKFTASMSKMNKDFSTS